MPRTQSRKAPKIAPSDTSDTYSDRPNDTPADADVAPEYKPDRVVDSTEAGLGGGLDEAEEAQLGVTDEELEAEEEPDLDPAKIEKGYN